MDRETALLVAVAMLALAALAVAVSGWVLLGRDRRFGRDQLAVPPSDSAVGHPEVSEEV